MPDKRWQDLVGKLRKRPVLASVSGGKDSAAMSLYLRELGIEHERVFLDTGWEHDLTYEYLRGELTRVLGPIRELRGPLQMEDLVRKKGMFPSRVRRFCTEHLKVKPMQAYVASLDYEVINTVGIRKAESEARSRMVEWEWSDGFDCEVWRPILEWTEQDVIDIHKRHGLRPNPLYLMGASRVGCWPCIFARKSEVKFIADHDPARIDRLRALEAEVTESARARAQERGEELRSERAWFQSRDRAEEGKGAEMWPIDRVVDWARTGKGGRQFELFEAGTTEDGCMRWGLCETNEFVARPEDERG